MRRSSRAFTLLELIVATAMVAVLAGSLYASLHIAFRAKESAMRAVESVRKCEVAMSILKEDIQSAMEPNGTLAWPFTGGSDSASLGLAGNGTLSLATTAADIEPDVGIGDIKFVEYFCRADDAGTGNVLARQVTTNLLATREVEPAEEIICRGVKSFSLRYYDGTAWQEAWDSTTQGKILPLAVEVTIELNEPAPGSASDAGYKMTRIFVVPCGRASQITSSTEAPG